MRQHRYRITIEQLAAAGANTSAQGPISFEVTNHDNIFEIIERAKKRSDLSPEHATAFAVGLKLFSEVMLHNRGLPLFSEFQSHFKTFMQKLKQ